ncbi:hypothetical protein Sjap_000472 [Stephania japonica]|uniref:Uncharacterized protein n=1 Tax=Stephania japonica TaxID=461633 RepID=A0AAP0PQS1_9MAGN
MLALCSCSASSRRALVDDIKRSMLKRHEHWKALYGRVYKDVARMRNASMCFKENVKYIEQFNKAANHSYKLSLNEFADLTNEVLKVTRYGYNGELRLEDKLPRATSSSFIYENAEDVPSTMDRRTKGAVTPVKNQDKCVQITGYEHVPANNESALLKAAANQPVSVSIDANDSSFKGYSTGVYNGPCGTKLNHIVIIVGYGVSNDGTKYWLAKNSWGTNWGESGYIRTQRDVGAKEGLCGLAMEAISPTA